MTEPPKETRITARISRTATIVHNYRYFYYLANEMADRARQEEEQYRSSAESSGKKHTPLNEYRYAIATVVLSFTFAEIYVNHFFDSPDSPIGKMFRTMSNNLKKQIDRLPIPEKLEFVVLHYPESKGLEFDRGSEPFQSFDLLRQLRNFLIHYRPRIETTWSEDEDYQREVLKLERKVRGRFAFNEHVDANDAFVYRCFSKDCARWSFEVSRNFVYWISETLSIDKPILRDLWPLDDDE